MSNFLDEMRKQGKAFKGAATRKRQTRPGGPLCKTPGLRKSKGKGPFGIPMGGK